MGTWVNIGILACVIIAAVIGVIVAIIRYGKEDEYLDQSVGINFMSKHCDGRMIGVEKKSEVGKDGRKIITFSPRDVNPHEIDKIKDVVVIVDKNKCISLPKSGDASRDKNINVYLPPNPSDFPEALKNNLFGKTMMLLTAITNAENTEIDAFKEGMKRQSAHIKAMATGEVSLERMTQVEEIYNDLLDAAKEAKKDKFSSPGNVAPLNR